MTSAEGSAGKQDKEQSPVNSPVDTEARLHHDHYCWSPPPPPTAHPPTAPPLGRARVQVGAAAAEGAAAVEKAEKSSMALDTEARATP